MARSEVTGSPPNIEIPMPTPEKEMDKALKLLTSHSQEWANLNIEERIILVEQIIEDFNRVTERWSQFSTNAKGITNRHLGNDREWLEISTINRMHAMLLRSLRQIRNHRKPVVEGGYQLLPNEQVAARVYPDSLTHGLAFRGITMDIWLEPDITKEEAETKQAENYFTPNRQGKTALVLGAGNASSLIPSDTIHKLFNDLTVVILKMNPVNSYLGPLVEEAYQALIKRGFLQVVYGGPEAGDYLVNHDLVDEIHMTGSDRTFDSIVFGSGEAGLQRKEAGEPIINKPIEGELGCITPWIIVPGDWTLNDLKEQASKLAYWMMRHEGYLCFSPRIIVLHRAWELGEAFQEALLEALSKVEPIKAYYPGSAETQKTFVKAHPEAIEIGGRVNGQVPWTVIPDLNPSNSNDICFRRESFSGLCGIINLDGSTIAEFLANTVEFLNHTVWGTLSATLVVSEKSLKDPDISTAVERAILDLRYGTVALNGPGTWGFYTMIAPWGGYPGSDLSDIQSGTCRVANFLFLHRPQKTVVRAPFKMRPYTFLGTARNLDKFSKKLAHFERHTSAWKLPGLLWSAMRT